MPHTEHHSASTASLENTKHGHQKKDQKRMQELARQQRPTTEQNSTTKTTSIAASYKDKPPVPELDSASSDRQPHTQTLRSQGPRPSHTKNQSS